MVLPIRKKYLNWATKRGWKCVTVWSGRSTCHLSLPAPCSTSIIPSLNEGKDENDFSRKPTRSEIDKWCFVQAKAKETKRVKFRVNPSRGKETSDVSSKFKRRKDRNGVSSDSNGGKTRMTFHLSPHEWKNVNDVPIKQGDDKAVFCGSWWFLSNYEKRIGNLSRRFL